MVSESAGDNEPRQQAFPNGMAGGNAGRDSTGDSASTPASANTEEDPGQTVAPNVIPHDEADGRAIDDWKSRYPPEARTEIRWEAVAVAGISIGSLIMIFVLWSGLLVDLTGCAVCHRPAFSRYGYFFLGGVLGGTLFGIKWLYHVVARGFWNQDRRLWRVLSPLLAGSLAFMVGALTDAGFLGLTISASKPQAFLSLGFITGYFGDKALAKMTEIADVIFGTREGSKPSGAAAKGDGQQ